MKKTWFLTDYRYLFTCAGKFLKIMKISIFIIVFASMQTFALNNYAQTKRMDVKIEESSIVSALEKIETQSEFFFFYNNKVVKLDKKVSVDLKNKTINEILDAIFEDTDIEYTINNRQIILSGKETGSSVSQQQKTVSGKVTESSGTPLPGVTVVVKGTTQGIITDVNGNYSLSNVPADAVLVLSFVGMKKQEIKVKGISTINVKMEEETVGIEEVVAVGYGTARRKDISGSVSTVKMEDSPVSIAPMINALESLKGTVTGLNIGTVNSAGDTPDILIRGQNSISGSNSPLIVLDGVIFMGSVGDINPNDIATIDILKDASSAAVYGSRASNGVIMITSKKGKTAKPTIRLNTYAGIDTWQQKPKLMSPERHLESKMTRLGIDDYLLEPTITDTERENIMNGKTIDWLDLGSRVGQINNHQLTVSGRGKGLNYYISTGYTNQEGVIVGDDYSRVSLRGKIDAGITDWLDVGVDGSYNYSDYSGIGANMRALMMDPPYGNAYWDKENKHLERYPIENGIENGLWGTDGTIQDMDHRNFFRIAGYANVKIPFVKGLSYRLNYVRGSNYNFTGSFNYEGYYVSEGNGDFRYSPEELQKKLSVAGGSMGRVNKYDYVIDNIINYKRQLKDHFFDVTFVATRDYSYQKSVSEKGNDFAANGNTSLGIDGLHKATVQSFNIDVIEKGNIGYLARLSYGYKDKYHLTISTRRDGSSVFGSDKKWGNFPSVGFAWTATEEKFLKGNCFIDYLKMRASYGKNGNQGVSPYGTLARISNGKNGKIRYEFSDNPSKVFYGTVISTLGNSSLGWETTTVFDGGLESVLWNNRIFFDADFYISKTTDQLFVRQIPAMTGFNTILSSLGQINNRGIELSLRTINVKNQNFNWTSQLTFWQNRNILAKLYGDDINGDGIEDDDIANSLFIGKSLGAIYGFEFAGIVQADDTKYIQNTGAKPGDAKFKDISGPDGTPDGLITADYDRKILGFSKENFRLNFANTLNYKGFELYVLLSGIFGGGKDNYYLKSNKYAFMLDQNLTHNNFDHPWWTPENKSNIYPSANYTNERFMGYQSRTFVRIQDVTLSYRFSQQSWMEKINIESLKVYAGIKNLYTYTGWVGGDPEEGVEALTSDSYSYPVPSTYTIGLDISF